MKKKKYEQPEIKVVEVGGETILAGSDGINAAQLEYDEIILDEDFE